jgi:hypothetical protein
MARLDLEKDVSLVVSGTSSLRRAIQMGRRPLRRLGRRHRRQVAVEKEEGPQKDEERQPAPRPPPRRRRRWT